MVTRWLVCLCSASDNIPKADEIRTLVKDIWDTRIAKLRLSADNFISQMEAYARVGITNYIYLGLANAPNYLNYIVFLDLYYTKKNPGIVQQ